jgi:hypothetical protein
MAVPFKKTETWYWLGEPLVETFPPPEGVPQSSAPDVLSEFTNCPVEHV